jgi:DNA invertase Pin-like site-specific DNA recombinase
MTSKSKTVPRVRCAIYTRKSTEENLDSAFNSLDAQREAAEAYIVSQREVGWTAVPDRYDDGGCSGGNLERPGLQRLLGDVEAGAIDCVVVYKVDRLSRSLLDFAKLIELFERKQVSFVSVTQQFNTTTSMGRLMLNVLLSFAQFEREIIGERIRDKIAATKRKGKYTGGPPVFGYDVDRERKRLVVNSQEAELVRHIFGRFAACASTTLVAQELNAAGHRTKSWTTKKGVTRAGRPWNKGYIYRLLHNPLYRGEVGHNGDRYPGEHEAIVPRELWEQAHAVLEKHRGPQRVRLRNETPALLKGLLRCAHCDCAMGPAFTRRRGRIYGYYLCVHAAKHGHRTPEVLARSCQENGTHLRRRDILRISAALEGGWEALSPAEQERIVRAVVTRVDVHPDRADVQFSAKGLAALIADMNVHQGAREVAA